MSNTRWAMQGDFEALYAIPSAYINGWDTATSTAIDLRDYPGDRVLIVAMLPSVDGEQTLNITASEGPADNDLTAVPAARLVGPALLSTAGEVGLYAYLRTKDSNFLQLEANGAEEAVTDTDFCTASVLVLFFGNP